MLFLPVHKLKSAFCSTFKLSVSDITFCRSGQNNAYEKSREGGGGRECTKVVLWEKDWGIQERKMLLAVVCQCKILIVFLKTFKFYRKFSEDFFSVC